MISTLFRKQDDHWMSLLQCVLSEITEATLPSKTNVGNCRLIVKSTNKTDVDLLHDALPELMIRVIECGRLSNPDNGEIICRIKLTGNGRISYSADSSPYYWKLDIAGDILEWG